MNKIGLFLFAIFTIACSTVFAQTNIRISDEADIGTTFQIDCTTSASEATTQTKFYDDGLTGNYSTNQTYDRILASTNGGAISVRFTQFNLATGTTLTISDAVSTAVLVSNATGTTLNGQTITSNRGALRFQWTSGSTVAAGFEAKVWCGSMCQAFQTNVSLNITPTTVDGDTYYDVCNGTDVTFSAVNTFPNNNQGYQQSDATLTYDWAIISNGSDTTWHRNAGQNFTHRFNESGGFMILCDPYDDHGCYNREYNLKKIRVSLLPTWEEVSFGPDNICPGTEVSFEGAPTVQEWSMPIPDIIAGTTFLPDGNSTCYNTSLEFDMFPAGSSIQSLNDIDHVYLNMEHSYFGDLSIVLQCPNGQMCLLHAQGGTTMGFLNWTGTGNGVSGSNGGGVKNLGLAPDPISSTSDCYGIAGTGYPYRIYSTGTVPFGDNSPTHTVSWTDPCGATMSTTVVDSVPANGQYGPYQSMASLVGCPLNGTWTIYVCDHLGSDNGYIFEWGLYFNDDLYPDDLWTFNNTYQQSTYTWSGENIVGGTNTNGNMQARPQNPDPDNPSQIPYTFSATDDFGCSYDTTVTVNVLSALDPSCCIQPDPQISATSTSPCSNSTGLTAGAFDIEGNTGEWTYTGPGIATFTAPNQPVTDVTVNVYGEYVFTWHEYYQGNISCNGEASITINFARPMNATLADVSSVCRSASLIQLSAPDFGTLSCSPNTAALNLDARTFNPGLANAGTYTITNTIAQTERCADPRTSSVTFTVYDEVTVSNRDEVCSAGQGATVTVSFNVNGSGATTPAYNITGTYTANGVAGNINETNLTANSYSFTQPSILEYALTISDVNGCGSVNISGYKDCGCPNIAGTFEDYTPQIMCTGERYTIDHSGNQELDLGGVFSYIVCTNPLNINGSHVQTLEGTTQSIALGDISGGSFNTQYYLVAVAGYGAGLSAWTDGCRSVTQAVPIMWKESPTPYVAAGDTCGLVMRLRGSALAEGMTGYWTATGPADVTNYSYTTVEGTTNTMPNAMVIASHHGEATYTWHVVNGACESEASATYTFRQVPHPEAGPDFTVCGVQAEITGAYATRPIIEGSTLQWTGNGVVMNPATGIQPVVNANGPGTYTITLTERNGECAGSDVTHITFVSVPSPTTTPNVDTVCGPVAELQVFNTNPANQGRWTAYTDEAHTQILDVTSYTEYGVSNSPSAANYPHCLVTVPFPTGVNEVAYDFVWSEPITDPRLPDDAECMGEAVKRIVFRKLPVVSVYQCGSTGNSTVVCGADVVELCAETSASGNEVTFAWLVKGEDVNGRFLTDSTAPNTTFELDSSEQISGYRDVDFYFTASNRTCTTIDTMHVRFLQKPEANAGRDFAVCGRDYLLTGAWSIMPNETYTPIANWNVISRPEGASAPTWDNTPHDSIVEGVHVSRFGVYQFTVRETNTAAGNTNCYDIDTVTIEFMQQPNVSAGPDFNVCGLDFTMNATGSHVEGDNIQGVWAALSGGDVNAIFGESVNDPHATGHYSQYGQARFAWIETNHPQIEAETQTCAGQDEVVVTFYEVPTANILMNEEDTITCGLTFGAPLFLRAENPGDGISGMWYSDSPSTLFGDNNSTVSHYTTEVTVPSYGRHDFYWIAYTGPENDPRFCKDTSDAWTIEFVQMPSADIISDSITFCGYDGQLNINFNGVGVGSWSSNSGAVSFDDVSNPNSGIHTTILNSDNASNPVYYLYWHVENTDFCTDEDTVKAIFARIPSGEINIIPPKCFGEAAVITAVEDSLANYEWDFGDGIVDSSAINSANGKFRAFVYWEDRDSLHTVNLSATNSWGCRSNVGQAVINEPTLPEYTYNIISDTCMLGKGGIEFLDTTGYFAFFWIDSTAGPDLTGYPNGYPITDFQLYNLPAGKYVYRSDYRSFNTEYYTQYTNYFGEYNCHDYPEIEIGATGMIDAEIAIQADVVLSELVAPEAVVVFTNTTDYDGNNNRVCEWHFGDGTTEKSCDEAIEHIYTEPGCYEPFLIVKNRDYQQCRDTAFLDECVFIDKASKLEVPNIFSPNGDGINDYFQVSAQTLKTFHGTIINRYGRVVYEWEDWETLEAGWDGRLNGSTKGTPGVYYYIIKAEGFDEVVYELEGALHLVK